ncbi:MAG: hypothetical protein AAF581_22980 [Planctomycetota bacterium]
MKILRVSVVVTMLSLLALSTGFSGVAWAQPGGASDDRFHLHVPPIQYVQPGADFSFVAYLDSMAGTLGPAVNVQSWGFGLCLDATLLEPLAIEYGATLSAIVSGGTTQTFYASWAVPGEGFFSAGIIDLSGMHSLPPTVNAELELMTCRAIGPGPYTASLDFCATIGVPPVSIIVVMAGGQGVLPEYTGGQVVVSSDPVFRRGDCDGDGSVSLADPVHLLEELFVQPSGNLPCAVACDADDNDTLNLVDAVVSLVALFGSPGVPLPGPACGPEQTPGALGCSVFASCP